MHFVHTDAPEPIGPAGVRLLLAPGSMGPMDSPTLDRLSQLLSENGVSVSRFEFAYMAQRRTGGKKRPPPRAERLVDEYVAAVGELRADIGPDVPLAIGGKSLGGRVASMVAQDLFDAGAIVAVAAFGYPFHPPKKPDTLRTAHLEKSTFPMIIAQGERDPFGPQGEVASYPLSPAIAIHWARDGDHDLKPRKASGATHDGNLAAAAEAVAGFLSASITRQTRVD